MRDHSAVGDDCGAAQRAPQEFREKRLRPAGEFREGLSAGELHLLRFFRPEPDLPGRGDPENFVEGEIFPVAEVDLAQPGIGQRERRFMVSQNFRGFERPAQRTDEERLR